MDAIPPRHPPSLVVLSPSARTLHVSQGRTVLATGFDGFIDEGTEQGLLWNETRLLSRWRWRIDGEDPEPIALSNLEQHSWLGYYALYPPGQERRESDSGSGMVPLTAERALELRLTRYVGAGVHEDVDLVNFSPEPTEFHLELEVDADFADQDWARAERTRLAVERDLRFDAGDLLGLGAGSFLHLAVGGVGLGRRRLVDLPLERLSLGDPTSLLGRRFCAGTLLGFALG